MILFTFFNISFQIKKNITLLATFLTFMITLSFGTSFLVKKNFPLHRINHKKGIKKLISIKIITQSFFFHDFKLQSHFFFSSALFLDFLIHFLYFHHKKKKNKVSVIKLNSCKVTILISYFPSFFIFIFFFFIFLIKALHLICHHKYRLVS